MPRFRVTGESVVVWEVKLDADDYVKAGEQAIEFVGDMLQLEGFLKIEAAVDSQSDRLMKVRQIGDDDADGTVEA